MGTTLGTGLVLIASMVLFSALESRPVLHEVLIGVFMTLNTPVTFVLLVRARAVAFITHRPAVHQAGALCGSPQPSPGR